MADAEPAGDVLRAAKVILLIDWPSRDVPEGVDSADLAYIEAPYIVDAANSARGERD